MWMINRWFPMPVGSVDGEMIGTMEMHIRLINVWEAANAVFIVLFNITMLVLLYFDLTIPGEKGNRYAAERLAILAVGCCAATLPWSAFDTAVGAFNYIHHAQLCVESAILAFIVDVIVYAVRCRRNKKTG